MKGKSTMAYQQIAGGRRMTEEELQELINFLVSQLKILREGYNDYYGVKHQLLDDEEQTGGTERKERGS